MATIKLLSWHADVAAKAALLQLPRLTVDATPLARTSAVVGEMAALNPAALVLDLDRLPSHAREIALALRTSKSARHIPILFAGSLPSECGLPEKFGRLRSELPDIPYAEWKEAKPALSALLLEPAIAPPVVPPRRIYTNSLPRKLGIVSGSSKTAHKPRQIALIAAPEGFEELLGDLPETVAFTTRMTPSTHLALCFIRTLEELAAGFDLLGLRLPAAASAWIVYPKCDAKQRDTKQRDTKQRDTKQRDTKQRDTKQRDTKQRRDFNEYDVRKSGIAAGFVDYKICSVDASWSGMKFARRKPSP